MIEGIGINTLIFIILGVLVVFSIVKKLFKLSLFLILCYIAFIILKESGAM